MVLALGRYTMAQKQHMLPHLIILLIAISAAPSSNGLQDVSRDRAAAAVTAAANTTQASQPQTTPTATAPLSSVHRPAAVITSAAGGPHPHNITQQHQSGIMTHHDPSSLAASHSPPAAPPLIRRIVPDLTPQLQTELAAHNISVLLVVADPSGDSSSSSINSMKIDWNSLTMLKKVYFLNSYKEFQQKWSTYLLLYHDKPAAHHPPGPAVSELPGQQQLQRQLLRRHLSPPPAEAGSQSQQGGAAGAQSASHSSQQLLCDTLCGGTISQQLHHRKHHEHHEHPAGGAPNVAVMSWAVNGRVGLKQLHLVEAVSRRIRRMHKLNLDYSTWNDKGDSLIAFTPDGQPQSATFLTTAIYRDAFSKIYSGKVWGPDGGGSGLGSTLNYTMNIRQELPRLIAKYNISSMLDSSCGSMHWMPEVVQAATATRPNFTFMGTDVVCSLIEQHKANFVNITNMQFQCIDYSNQNLPSGYDLIFSRDSLQHVPQHAAWMFLNNVKASGARYLLVGSYLDLENVNGRDIAGGDYYAIDLTRPPFNVWPTVEVIDEQTADGKHMVLFDMRSVTWADDLQGLV